MSQSHMKQFSIVIAIAFVLLVVAIAGTHKDSNAKSKVAEELQVKERKGASKGQDIKDKKEAGKEKKDSSKGKDKSAKGDSKGSNKQSKKLEKSIVPADRVSARRHLVYAVHQAIGQKDFEEASILNSFLSQEAFQRAYRVQRVWKEQIRDKKSGLIPRSSGEQFWNGKDTGADCFPFLFLTSHYLDPESEPVWQATMAKERELCGALPKIVRFSPTRVEDMAMKYRIFDGAEYIKDGLISIADRRGRGPWFDRMTEVMDALIQNAAIETQQGKICANDSEVNGDLLQSLPRLYWATGKAEYLAMAERIAETYFFDIFPKNNGLPAAFWDFEKGAPVDSPHFKFRDHGNEVIPGLTEVYLLEKLKGRPQAERYRKPLKDFLELVLAVERSEDGMWLDVVDTKTRKATEKRVVDNWGYILNAYRTFDLVEGTNVYDGEIQRVMRAAATRKSFQWEGVDQDGYADSIESMIYQLSSFDIPECRLWMDDEIEVMFLKQQNSGLVETTYLDGNFARTSLLYGQYKTQGTMPSPWREDVRVGAVQDKQTGTLYLAVSSTMPWEGVLQFDYPRHKAIWNLPVNYPRLNAWPEWFVAESGKQYSVMDVETNKETVCPGESLVKGFPIKLDGNKTILLKVSSKSGISEPVKTAAVSSR